MCTISAMADAMCGRTLCVAAKRELWATPPFGGAFPVHSIVDETTDDLPFCCVYVTDYLGNRYPFEILSDKSQNELFDFAIGEYYSDPECDCDWVQDDDDIAWWLSHMEG